MLRWSRWASASRQATLSDVCEQLGVAPAGLAQQVPAAQLGGAGLFGGERAEVGRSLQGQE